MTFYVTDPEGHRYMEQPAEGFATEQRAHDWAKRHTSAGVVMRYDR